MDSYRVLALFFLISCTLKETFGAIRCFQCRYNKIVAERDSFYDEDCLDNPTETTVKVLEGSKYCYVYKEYIDGEVHLLERNDDVNGRYEPPKDFKNRQRLRSDNTATTTADFCREDLCNSGFANTALPFAVIFAVFTSFFTF